MKPKYAVGDKVWRLYDGKIRQEEITSLRAGLIRGLMDELGLKKTRTFYYGFGKLEYGYERVSISDREDTIFATKEELIASL